MPKRSAVLTIAGSDSSGGAGIQADLKTMTVHDVYAMSAITALTAQNTTGVFAVHEVPAVFLKQQLDAVFTDIPPDAVKIGMLSSPQLIEVVAERLSFYTAKNIVLDPVAVATSGSSLTTTEAYQILQQRLFPLASLVTPNIPEAELLSGIVIQKEEDMETAARSIQKNYGCAVLCKGGHNRHGANDFLLEADGTGIWLREKFVPNPNTHGTGCTLSSAIAANLAKGYSLLESVRRAKSYLTGALQQMLDLGKGSGPLDHGYLLKQKGNKQI